MQYYEVQVTAQKTYTVFAENLEEAYDAVQGEFGSEYIEMQGDELETEEEIERSKRHSDMIIEL